MIERFIFESSGHEPEVSHPGLGGAWSFFGSIWRTASTHLLGGCRVGQELGHPQQAVAADGERRHEASAAEAAYPHLAHRASVFSPTEGFLDALADALAGQVARMARGAFTEPSPIPLVAPARPQTEGNDGALLLYSAIIVCQHAQLFSWMSANGHTV